MEDRKPNESQFINFNPIKALTILAELLAEQEGKKAVNVSYQDGVEADGHSFTKQVLVGSHRLPTQDEVKTASENLIPGGKTLAGWKAVNKDGTVSETIYAPGSLYDFTADITFTAVFEDAAMPPDENNSSSEGEEP